MGRELRAVGDLAEVSAHSRLGGGHLDWRHSVDARPKELAAKAVREGVPTAGPEASSALAAASGEDRPARRLAGSRPPRAEERRPPGRGLRLPVAPRLR